MMVGLSVELMKRVDGFTLEVGFAVGNELAVLFGASGAGKSMTLQLIAGLAKPDRGRIALNGTVLFDSTSGIDLKPQDRSIGYVFQNHSLFPHMTVLKNVMFGARGFARQEQREMAQELIRKFRLEGLENRFPSEISGGQQQRAALARAIIQKPAALLLDEPFSALDQPIRVKMRDCLGEVMKELSIPILLVTHDAHEACSLADQMVILENGRVARIGAPGKIMDGPMNIAADEASAIRQAGSL